MRATLIAGEVAKCRETWSHGKFQKELNAPCGVHAWLIRPAPSFPSPRNTRNFTLFARDIIPESLFKFHLAAFILWRLFAPSSSFLFLHPPTPPLFFPRRLSLERPLLEHRPQAPLINFERSSICSVVNGKGQGMSSMDDIFDRGWWEIGSNSGEGRGEEEAWLLVETRKSKGLL